MKQIKTKKLCKATRTLGHTLCRFLKDLFKWRRRSGPTSPPLDHLSDVALLAIFSHFPVAELLTRKALNVRLEGLQAEACRTQTKLHLLLGPDAEDLTSQFSPELDPFSTLTLGRLTMSVADRLVGQMPRLRCLLLVLPRIQEAEMSAILRLLRGWSGSLRQLDIYIYHPERSFDMPFSEQLQRLLASLNWLSQLKQLSFHLDGYLFPLDTVDQSLYLPVLAHLETLTFSSPDFADCLVDTLVHYLRESTQLARLTIVNLFTQVAVKRFLSMEPTPAKALDIFTPHPKWRPTYEQLGHFVHHFGGLRMMLISLHGTDYTLPAVVRLLRSLKDLQCVSLAFHSVQTEMDAIQGYLQQVGPEEEPVWNASPQVSRLDAIFYDPPDSHENIAALHLERFFPGIEELEICSRAEECAICGTFGSTDGREDRPEDKARAEACCQATEALMRPQFPLLREVQALLYC